MKVLLFANTDWYLYNFRRSLAQALRDEGHEVLLVSPDGPYGEKLRDLGYRWIAAPMDRRSLAPWREWLFIRWLKNMILRERPDLVHGFTIKCAIYGSLAARWAGLSGHCAGRVNAVAGMGYVFTSTDLKARLLRPLVRGLFRLALGGNGARLVLQNPDDVALFQRASLVATDSVRLVKGSGVDCRRFTPRTTDTSSSPGFKVLLPARLLWDKGIAEFVEAARIVKRQSAAVSFLLAGDPDPGNPAAVPVDAVEGWVREGILKWLGHVDDMPSLLQSVDVVALPSYREGLPKGLIEAAASGLPLITADVPGCREVVTHESDGLLVPVRDAPSLAAAILRLEGDAALRQRLGASAREKAVRVFDESVVIRETLAVYSEVLQSAGKQGTSLLRS